MNEAADELELYYKVYQRGKQWYVDVTGRIHPDKTYEFFDGIKIEGRTFEKSEKEKEHGKETAKRKTTCKR